MKKDTFRLAAHGCLALILSAVFATSSQAGMLSPGDGNERQGYSDMVATIQSAVYDAGTDAFSLSAFALDLELGSQFGPNNAGVHYGISNGGGTLGNAAFAASVSVSGVTIDDTGSVTNGGSVIINLAAPNAFLNADYGINPGDNLLTGTVEDALITNAPGGDVLDILFSISGGALQDLNPHLGINFAPNGEGILHFAGTGIPADWNSNFSLNGGNATLDVFGIPEPTTALLTLLSSAIALTIRVRKS